LAKRRRACDKVTAHPKIAVQGADLIVLATPVGTIPRLAREVAGSLEPGAIITDVGSTKNMLVQKLEKIFPPELRFIGGHPIAGTEKSGMAAALPNLFKDRWWIFTPTRSDEGSRKALKKLTHFAKALGSRTANLSPRLHDETLAAISHLPHAVAYTLVDTARRVRRGVCLKYAAGGFRDYTRIAASSPQMWADIFIENREEILRMLLNLERSIKKFKSMVSRRDKKALYKFLDSVAKLRRKF
jgi:cyclohexadieny/prephenate dehydrogenase